MNTVRILQKAFLSLFLVTLLCFFSEILTAMQVQDRILSAEIQRSSLTQLQQQFYKVEIEKEISVEIEDETLKDALSHITRDTGLKLTYRGDKMIDKRVSMHSEHISVSDALGFVLDGTGLDYKISRDGYLLIAEVDKIIENTIYQDSIEGLVTDAETGELIPGVNIVIKGTNIGTSTDTEGTFQLTVPSLNDTLVVSFIGYQMLEVPISNRTEINIELHSEIFVGDEMIVVGYGTQRKINQTGAVSSVNFDEKITNRPITDASQALVGQVPGLWVSQTSGQPGQDSALLRVRGWGTMNDANPMVIIDGVEGSMNQVNPNDIESVSVLRDAASAAIYGSRAANGVVLITTKSGAQTESPQVSFSSYVGFQSLARTYDIIDNSVEYMEMWNQGLINTGSDPIFPEQTINEFRNNDDPYLYPNTNFFDEVYRTASISEHNLSVSGGSENSSYYLSFNYMDQEGIMRQTGSERFGLNFNIQSNVNNWLDIGGRLSAMKQDSHEPYNMGRVPYVFANGAYPFTAPYNEDGTFGAVQAFDSNGEMIVGNRNPLVELYDGGTQSERIFAKINAHAEILFTDNLILTTNFTAPITHILTDKSNRTLVAQNSKGERAVNLDFGAVNTLEASRRNVTETNFIWFNTLNYNEQFGASHEVSAVGGMQIEDTSIKSSFSRSMEPPKIGLTQVSAGTSNILAEGNMQALRMMSFFGRVNYAFQDKYLFEANFRADASSRFAEGHRWGVFPGISIGWRITEEDFMAEQNLFSELKIRSSWGKLGNQNIAGYWPYLTTITQANSTSYNFGGSFAPGAAVTNLVDESITWEKTTVSDIGLEMYFLDNQLSVETSVFSRKTEDIIVRLPIPRTLGGVSAPHENVGEMINNGIEFNATFVNVAGRDEFGYTLGANFSYVTNEVTKFREGNSPDQLYLIREGHSFRSLYAFQAEGIYQTDQEAQEHMHSNAYTPSAGELRYTDVNGDGRLDHNDMMAIGNTIPKYNFGANLEFAYKGFDLGLILSGSAGYTVNTLDAWTRPLGISGGIVTKRWRDAWTPENTDTDIPMLRYQDNWMIQNSSFWMQDISFLKIRNVQLGYTFPTRILGLRSLYTYVNLQNYFTFVTGDYEGYDPERSTFTSGYNTYPLPKIISFGLNVNI